MAEPPRSVLTVIAALSGGVVAIFAAVWIIIGLKIDGATAPIQTEIEANRVTVLAMTARIAYLETRSAASSEADSLSRADRAQADVRISALEISVQSNAIEMRSGAASTSAKLIEIETQFQAVSNDINAETDHQQQLDAIIWEAVFHKSMPPSNFRPQMYK